MEIPDKHVDISFDSTLEVLRKQNQLTWYPWIGKNYRHNAQRIMFILESAYENDNNKETIVKNPSFTRQTIHEVFIRGDNYSDTLNNLRSVLRILIDDKTIPDSSIWENLVYHNVVQRIMDYKGKTREKPNPDDFRNGCRTLKEIIKTLKPTLCICMGVRLNKYILEDTSFGIIRRDKTENGNSNGKIGSTWMLDLLTLELNGQKTKLIFTTHPSRCAQKAWADYLNKYVPTEISQFKQNCKQWASQVEKKPGR